MAGEQHGGPAEEPGGRLAAGELQQREERHHLVGAEPAGGAVVAGDLRGEQVGDHVVARAAAGDPSTIADMYASRLRLASAFSALMPSGSKRIIRSPQMRSWSWSALGTPSSAPMSIAGILAAKSSTIVEARSAPLRVEELRAQLADAFFERSDAPRA